MIFGSDGPYRLMVCMALIMIQVAGPELERQVMMEGKTDDDTERQLVHTLQCSRHCFHCIDLLFLDSERRGRNIFAPFLLERHG